MAAMAQASLLSKMAVELRTAQPGRSEEILDPRFPVAMLHAALRHRLEEGLARL